MILLESASILLNWGAIWCSGPATSFVSRGCRWSHCDLWMRPELLQMWPVVQRRPNGHHLSWTCMSPPHEIIITWSEVFPQYKNSWSAPRSLSNFCASLHRSHCATSQWMTWAPNTTRSPAVFTGRWRWLSTQSGLWRGARAWWRNLFPQQKISWHTFCTLTRLGTRESTVSPLYNCNQLSVPKHRTEYLI